jgi:hypothetical protein
VLAAQHANDDAQQMRAADSDDACQFKKRRESRRFSVSGLAELT